MTDYLQNFGPGFDSRHLHQLRNDSMRRRQVTTADLQRRGLPINRPISRLKNGHFTGEPSDEKQEAKIETKYDKPVSTPSSKPTVKPDKPANTAALEPVPAIAEDQLESIAEPSPVEHAPEPTVEPAASRIERLPAAVNESDHTSVEAEPAVEPAEPTRRPRPRTKTSKVSKRQAVNKTTSKRSKGAAKKRKTTVTTSN